MKIYFPLLDGLRFFAAFWVMNFHYLFVFTLSSDLDWYRYGNLGVQLFFIISGFVIIQSTKGKTLGEFAKSRFIRLFPLFWILCTFTYLLTLVVPLSPDINLSEYFISMTMFGDIINAFTDNQLGLVDPSYWTLTVELIFYIAIGVFTYFFSHNKIRYFLFFWLLFSVLAFVYKIDHNFFIKLGLVRHASYFIFGGALALIIAKQTKSVFEKYFDYILLFTSAIYSVYIHPKAIPSYGNIHHLDNTIVTGLLISFFLLVIILVHISKHVTNSKLIKLLAILGGLSYPLYLLHQTIGNTVINYMTNKYDISWNNFAIGFEIFIIISAYLVYLYDKKMRTWLKSKF